jgi:apolipoprotein D and lipocalin family protein
MSKIDMTYFWIFTKSYGVYYLEDDYSSAVVADSELEQLWIMSRTPKMQEEKLQKILALLENKMNLKSLIFTPQDPKGRYK